MQFATSLLKKLVLNRLPVVLIVKDVIELATPPKKLECVEALTITIIMEILNKKINKCKSVGSDGINIDMLQFCLLSVLNSAFVPSMEAKS